jgi:Predicted membrane protein (DUF2306)
MTNTTTTALPTGEFVSLARRLSSYAPHLVVIFLVLLLAVPTGIVAVGEATGVLPLPFNLFLVDERLPGIFKLHMLASGAALLLIPLVIALRRRRTWHKPLGRLAAALVLLGALTALPVALASHSVAMARAGFFAQGLVWLSLIALGVIAVRERRFALHARLMLAMAAVASGALWVRLTTAVATTYGLPFDQVYGCIAWLGWMVPLALTTLFAPSFAPARP